MTETQIKEKYKREWWLNPENNDTVSIPISSILRNGQYTVCTNDDSKKYIGEYLHGMGFGETKEKAIDMMFYGMQSVIDYDRRCRMSYIRFVPFVKGGWSSRGGRWFIIFGFQFYFRYGKGMNRGIYIPFTKLNIMFTNHWNVYNKIYVNKTNEN